MAVKSLIKCYFCGLSALRENTAITRAKKENKNMFCDRTCAGLSRRKNKTEAQKKTDKAVYDVNYRESNRDKIKINKANWFNKTYDPLSAAIERKLNMPRHLEYCRQPEYVAKKKIYDRKYKAKKAYGNFWEAAVLVLDIDDEIEKTTTKYQIRLDNGLANKTQKRKRDYERLNSNKSERCPLGNA